MLRLNEIKTSFQKERQIGISSILKSTILTQKIFKKLIKDQVITKEDKSPVTIGDYGSQALINLLISKHFPQDKIIGEEEIKEIQTESQEQNLNEIQRLINETLQTNLANETDEEVWTQNTIPKSLSKAEILETINVSNRTGEAEGNGQRFWTLDPIDGTKGFLRSDQYSICLSLIINNQVTLSFISAPNLSTDPYPSNSPNLGTLFFAEHGKGAFQRPIHSDHESIYQPINIHPISFDEFQSNGTFCESFESNHSDQILNSKILNHLKLSNPRPIRLDSQVKYCLIARGDVNVYLRLPIDLKYKEKIWDHAAGSLLVEEAGGKVTDMWGQPLDFSIGKTLSQNEGIVASHPILHSHLLDAIKSVSKR